jgi:4-amino-4-deoxy-L-arabinose transferase-like glycosyltransferase
MKLHPALGLSMLLVIISIPIFLNIGYYPIRLWDESRVAINAYEMYKNGNWIVTTFNYEPDMWNTKPPLLTWIQTIFLHVFGLHDMSIRIVSPLAAIATCVFIYWFTAKKFKQPWLGILICIVLVTSRGYIRLHGVRTGEYDALLVMFTTMYALYYFLYLEENNKKYLYAFAITLTLAALTKGVAALLFIPALIVFTLIRGKILQVLKSRHLYISILIFIVFVFGYYLLREKYNPGFLQQVYMNELGGRYAESEQDPKYDHMRDYYWYFLTNITFIRWLIPMYISVVLGFFTKDKLLRRLSIFSVLVGFSNFIIVSYGSTKNEWYDMGCYPFFAITTGIGIFIVCRWLMKITFPKKIFNYALAGIFVIAISWLPYKEVIEQDLHHPFQDWSQENDSISFYVKDIYEKNKKTDDLVVAYVDYQADLDWYRLLLAEQKRPIDRADYKALPTDKRVIAYQAAVKKYIDSAYNAVILDTFNTLRVYKVNGPKQ